MLASLYNGLIVALAALAAVIVANAVVLVIADVLVRFAGFAPLSFTIAVVEYGLLYFTLLAAPYLLRQKRHVYVGTLISALPGPVRMLVAKLIYLLCFVATLFVACLGVILLIGAFKSGFVDQRSINIPYWILYLPIPLCFALVACEFGRYLIGLDDMYEERVKQESL